MWLPLYFVISIIFANTLCKDDRQPLSNNDATKYLLNFGYMSKSSMLQSSRNGPQNIKDAREALRKAILFRFNINNKNFNLYQTLYATGGDIICDPKILNAFSHSLKFQEFAGLPKTGELDEKTLKKMGQPRCGLQDVFAIRSGVPQKWHKDFIRYSVDSYSFDLPRDHIRRAMNGAFKIWSKVIPVNFEEIVSGGDIRIKFASKRHGDPWPFDGKGGVLAHATFPPSGLLHFDDDENWVYMDGEKISRYDYTDLLAVAIHEIGHTLGLEHSKIDGSIMAPFYQETVDRHGNYIVPDLHSDDIEKIQDLYGIRNVATDRPPTKPTTSTNQPKRGFWDRVKVFLGFGDDTVSSDRETTPSFISTTPTAPFTTSTHTDRHIECPLDVDAIMKAYDKTYLFSGSKVFEIRQRRIQAVHSLKQLFPKSPPFIQGAMFSAEANAILLFQSKKIYSYQTNRAGKFAIKSGYPKRLPKSLLFNPMGAFTWIDGRKVLVNGYDFVIYDEYWNEITLQNKIPNYFDGFPNKPIRGIIIDESEITIFTNDDVYAYDARNRKINGRGIALRKYLYC